MRREFLPVKSYAEAKLMAPWAYAFTLDTERGGFYAYCREAYFHGGNDAA